MKNFLLKEDVRTIIKSYWKQFLGISFLIGFLLFLLNIFLSFSSTAVVFGDTLKDKLGIFFYIKDMPGEERITYEKIISLKDELKEEGLEVMFSSKDDALKFLENKIPDVVSNFEKFGIENPIPSTLYVMFKNKDQYQTLRTIVLKYRDIILNIKDINSQTTIKQQENRILNFINLANFISGLSIAIIVIIFAIILSFLGYFSKTVFEHFKSHFHLQRMLGTLTKKMTMGFVALNSFLVLVGFIICFTLLLICISVIGIFAYDLFDVGLIQFASSINLWFILLAFIIEIIVITGLSGLFSYYYVLKLNKAV